MTTPAQNVPDDFMDVLDMPAPGYDEDLIAQTRWQVAANKKQVDALNNRVAALKKQAAAKGISKASKKIRDQRVAAAQKQLAAAQSAQLRDQNTLFQVTGEYDKLLSGDNRDAYKSLKALFSTYGLESLAPKIFEFLKEGYGADTIAVLLQDTKEYKTRFAANEARAKAGLPVLNPADYLATEQAYRQILSSAGLPAGFYDNPADFVKWISDDVSPTEIKGRVDMAVAATTQANPQYKEALFQMYGINEGDLTAYFLDRKRAEPILKKQAAAGAIGAAAIRRGFAANVLDLEGYATLGITADQAEEAYARIADGFESMLGIAGRYGTSWTQREAEQELFTPGAAASVGGESAAEKGKRLRSQERALFAGGRGASVQGLNAGYSQT